MHVPVFGQKFTHVSRIRMDGAESEERLVFELEVDNERVVWASLDKMLDALWFAQEIKLISALPAAWWENVNIHKDWGKPVRSPKNQAKLDKLDEKFAAKHARAMTKSLPGIQMDGDTDAPYTLLLLFILNCVFIAEQLGVIPPFGDEWLAREIPPMYRDITQIGPAAQLH